MLCQVRGERPVPRDPWLPPPADHGASSTAGRLGRVRRRATGRGPRPADPLRHPCLDRSIRLPPTYPQDAQTAVEMLIIQRSQIAGFSVRSPLAGWPKRPYIPSCAEHGAGVGRSSTGRLYGTARKGRNGKPVGVVDETATGSANFFGPFAPAALARLRSPRCRFPLVLHARRASTRA
jgi:hypothetical protein